MKFAEPAGLNPIDRARVVGQPHTRIEGPLKVAGAAPYAYERHDVAPDAAYGWIVGSAIAKGRITRIDTALARNAAGVITVVTRANAGKVGKSSNHTAHLFAGPEIEHYDQAVALVVAETLEQARHAAQLVAIDYEREEGRFDLAGGRADAQIPKPAEGAMPTSSAGDFDGAFAAALIKLDATYTTPDQTHAMMEPHATTAAWDGDKVTLWTSNQMIAWAVRDLAQTLGIAKDAIRIVSPYVGGGFGSKLWIRADAVLAPIAARMIGRPVKVAIARPQVVNMTTHRPATIQRLRIGTDRAGRIEAIAHESWSGDLPGGKIETACMATRLLYAGANRMTAHHLATLDLPEGNSMRAPGEAVGLLALEQAMDELAEKVGLDPVELRIRNDVQFDPEKGPSRPFSQRNFIGCLRTGAAAFDWAKRNPVPGQVREGRFLIGHGMAAAYRDNLTTTSAARVRLDQDGMVTVETDMTDIGTGSYTVIAQTAAEMLGVALDKVVVRLGDSDFPVSSGSGGQWGGNSSTAGVYAACCALREAIAKKLGFNSTDTVFQDGEVRGGGRAIPLAEAAGAEGISAEDKMSYGSLARQYAQGTFGAHFAEVAVDGATGEVRVRRMLAALASGRILNPVTARSQVIGAMSMGIGAALMEEAVVDTRHGFFVNHDMAEYHVPVHADVPHQEVIFLDELDDKSSPMKAKGVGELGLCGAGAAIANAVYNATGVRIRHYPLTLDKVLEGLAAKD